MAASLFVAGAALASPTTAQNLLQNPGFENITGTTFGNNIGASIAPWVIGVGQQPNVVQVDGAGGQSFSSGTFGPEFDAQNGGTGAGSGVIQHYLDVADGSNAFSQSFTVPACATNSSDITYTLSGFFSLRAGSGGSGGVGQTGTIEILNGVGTTGTPVPGSLATASIPASAGAPDVWVEASATVALQQGVTYSFVVNMPDPANFDEASLTLVPSSCPSIQAEDDDFSGNPFDNTGGTTTTVLANDTLNGSPVATDGSETTIAVTDDGGLTGVTIADNGVITVPVNATPGSYDITYLLSDQTNAALTDPAVVTVVVGGAGQLVSAIAGELRSTLRDNLAVTLTEQSARISDYAKSGLERLRNHNRSAAECAAEATLHARFIQFDTNSAVIKPESESALDSIAQILASCRGIALEIAGHTDSDASDDYNNALSQRRVDAVLNALQQRDIDTSGFVAKGYGESQPIAPNDTAKGKARNRRVEFNVIEGESIANFRACHDGAAPRRNLNARADENGVAINGDFQHQTFDCATNRWSIFDVRFGYTETDSGISQGSVNLSYRREKIFNSDRLGGFFVGAFGNHSDVDSVATGTINGAGVNAGFYGAQQLGRGLFLDGHVGLATGFQDFGLDFDTAFGEVDAEGTQHYFAGFVGAALSGEVKHENLTVQPRVGFNYAYSPASDVNVTAALDNLSETGNVDLGSIDGGSIFAELRLATPFNDNRSQLALTPRVACFQRLESFDDQCSLGGSLELSTLKLTDDFLYSVELSGEHANSFSRLTLSGTVSKALPLGTVDASAGVDNEGRQRLNLGYKLKF